MKINDAAVIDIGSNSVRYARCEAGNGLTRKELVSTRLGEGLALTGILSAAGIARTIEAAAAFAARAENEGLKVYCFATEAVRAASNRDEFLRAALGRGLKIDTLSGKREALIGFLGAAAGRGRCEAVDIGGASTEIVLGENQSVRYGQSFPVGAVRLTDMFGVDLSRTASYCDELLRPASLPGDGGELIAVGGTVTSLASIKNGIYDPYKNHGTLLYAAELETISETLSESSDIEADFPVLSPSRAKVIRQGLELLKAVMRARRKTFVTVSEKDNIEGYIRYKEIFS